MVVHLALIMLVCILTPIKEIDGKGKSRKWEFDSPLNRNF